MTAVLLASPAGSGVPLSLRGNWGIYAVGEQQLYRPQGGDADSGVTLYGRISVSPSDRNLISFYADGGVVVAGMIPQRPTTKLASASSIRASRTAPAPSTATSRPLPACRRVIRDYELNIELTYLAPGSALG